LVLQQVIILSHGLAHCCWRFNMSLLFHIEKFTAGVSTIKRSLSLTWGSPKLLAFQQVFILSHWKNSQLVFQWSTCLFLSHMGNFKVAGV
jgi:hypothetical protein